MDREKKNIDKTEIPNTKPTEEGEKAFVVTSIYYRKDARVRGFYYSTLVMRERKQNGFTGTGYTSESWILGQQSKTYLLAEAKRFSDKVLASLQLTPEQIAGVKAEAIASIR